MTVREDFEGFVPLAIYLPGQRIEGKVWKFADRRLLQQIEEDSRQFIPVVDAKLYTLESGAAMLTEEFDVLAVSKIAILAIQPKDTVTTPPER